MDHLLKDLTYAARGLRKNLGFSAVAAITIALGIGACTAIFSVVNAVLLRPLPYADAQRLVLIWGELRARNVNDWPFSPPDFRDLQVQSKDTFDDIAGMIPAGRTPISGPGGDPEQIRVGAATANLFRVLGARIALGRDFTDDDAAPQPQPPPGLAPGTIPPNRLPQIAIISHAFWMRRFGGDPLIVGQNVDLGGGRATGLRGGRGLRTGVVITEVALSFILLIGAGLMLRSVLALGRVNPGFDARNVLTFFLGPQARPPGEREQFMRQAREKLLAIPGVTGVTAALPLPLDGQLINGRWGTEAAVSDPAKFRQADFRIVLPGFFETLRTPLIAGRTFTDMDNVIDQQTDLPRQVVIDDALASLAFPGESAVGRRLYLRITTPEPAWYEVIGVVAHQRHALLAVPGPETVFITDGHFGHGAAARWAVRTNGDPMQIVNAVRAAVAQVDPRAPLAEVQPYQDYVDKAMAPVRFTSTLIGIFATIAVVLAAVGLYGVLSTIVRQRTAEIGMRMVFGAQRGTILQMVVGEGLRLSAGGIIVGLAAALAVTRVMRSMLVGVSANDPLTFVAIAVLFVAITITASWLPAYRASRLDPMEALREQ